MGQAQVGPVLQHRLAHRVEVVGAAICVDVLAVGRRVDDDCLGAGTAVGSGDLGRGTVGTVDHDLQPVQGVRGRVD